MQLKTELHSHAAEDKKHNLPYNAKQLIDEAKRLKYDVLGLSFHSYVFEGPKAEEARKHAKRKGLLLLIGCEANIEGKDILIYGITEKERKKITTLRKLREWKIKKERAGHTTLIMAPHPFFRTALIGKYCLGRKLITNIDIFDAVEYNFFYTKRLNKNKKGVRVADRYCKPIVGNGDVHSLSSLNKTYSIVNSEKNELSVMKAIKNGNVKYVTKPLTIREMSNIAILHSFKNIYLKIKNRKNKKK